MLERLDYVKLAPRRILDAGSGPPQRRAAASAIRRRDVVALDFSLPMLRPARRWAPFEREARRSARDMERLPLADGSRRPGVVQHGAALAGDPLPALREFERVLAPEGLLMFSTLGRIR